MSFRKRIEDFFEWWSEIVVSHRWQVLLATLAITLAVLPQMRHGWLDLSIESYMPQNDPAVVDFNEFRDQFGYGNPGMFIVELEDSIFTLDNLEKLRALHDAIESRVPNLEEVTSLVSVRYTRGEGDTLKVDELIELWPTTEEGMPAFRELVMNNPNYVGALVSEDAKVIAIVAKPQVYSNAYLESIEGDELDALMSGFDDEPAAESQIPAEETRPQYIQPEEEMAFSEEMFAIKAEFDAADFRIHSAGGPIMNYQLGKDMEEATVQSTTLGMGIIVLLLVILFRRASGVLMPMMVVSMSLMMTLALWPVLGFAYNGNTQIIPTFLLAVGVADAVHILSIFYRRYDAGDSKHDAIINAMKKTSIAVLMTTVTTAASLLSFLAADMLPTRTLGIFGAIGVVMALVYTVVLMPSLLAIVPIKRRPQVEASHSSLLGLIDRGIEAMGSFGVRHAKPVFIVTSVMAAVAIAGVLQVRFSHDPIRWYPPDGELRVSVETIDAKMDGSMSLQVILDAHEENALYEPDMLHLLEDVEKIIEDYLYVEIQAREAVSILGVVKETHQALNRNDPAFYEIPEDRQTIAQELLLFENSGSDDMDDFTDSQLSTARFAVQMPWRNVIYYREYTGNLKAKIEQAIQESGLTDVTVKVVGLLAIFGRAIMVLLQGTVQSYLLAFVLVGMMMFLLMGNLRRGLLAFMPNIVPIVFTVGLMGWLDMPLNMLTATIGCIIVGISVDDTIHFMHHFRRYAAKGYDVETTVHKTLHTCGRAITFTSIVLVGGFIVHVLDDFLTSKQFGSLLSLAIVLALLANLVLAPAMMQLFWKQEAQEKEEPGEQEEDDEVSTSQATA